jgi:hypothetical protein
MTALTKQAREAIQSWPWGRVTIAGYTRHFFPDGKWHGDRCGCVDDRCIGFHHIDESDCQCLPVWLDDYVKASSPPSTAAPPDPRTEWGRRAECR